MKTIRTLKNKLIISVQCTLAVFTLLISQSSFSSEDDVIRLNIQNTVDYTVPLPRTTWPGAHNGHSNREWGYTLPGIQNQAYKPSVLFQKGIRQMEIDIHPALSFSTAKYKHPALCHSPGKEDSFCTTLDRHLTSGLDDIINYIKSNQDAVLLIEIEMYKSNYNSAASLYKDTSDILESKLKPYIFRPANYGFTGSDNNNGDSCVKLPLDITKQDVLDAGKNIIFVSGCGDADQQGLGNFLWDSNLKTTISSTKNDCDGELVNNQDDYFNGAWDGDTNGNGKDAWLVGSKLVKMMKCGYNIIEAANIATDEGPSTSDFNWMWKTGEPNNYNNQDCAISGSSGKWSDKRCGDDYDYACSTSDGKNWKVAQFSNRRGDWERGDLVCNGTFGDSYSFAAPANAYENEKLNQAKLDAGVRKVWVRFNDKNLEGFWQATPGYIQMGYEVHDAIGGYSNRATSFNHDHMVKRRYLMSNEMRLHKISFNSDSGGDRHVRGMELCWAAYPGVNNNVDPDSTSDPTYEHCIRTAGDQGDTNKSFTLAAGEKITEWKICAKKRSQDTRVLVSYVRLRTSSGNRIKSGTHSRDADFCESATLTTPLYLVGAHGRASSYLDKLGFSFGNLPGGE